MDLDLDYNLPQTVTGPKLRQLSKTKMRSANLVRRVDYDDQKLAHKVPNEVLKEAYNSTDDICIKNDIVAFNYSSDNIFRSQNNNDHTRMERGFLSNKVSANDYESKAQMMDNALYKLSQQEYCADKSIAWILKAMAKMSVTYREFVGSLKKTSYNAAQVKKAIDQARR